MNKQKVVDIVERSAWTLVQTTSAAAIVEAFGLPLTDIPIIALGFAVVKSVLATRFGNGTAATLPKSLEPQPIVSLSSALQSVVAVEQPPTTP